MDEKYCENIKDKFDDVIKAFRIFLDYTEDYSNNIKGYCAINGDEKSKGLLELTNLMVDQIVSCSYTLNNISELEKVISKHLLEQGDE
jgi:hypothetical protein